MTLETPTLTRPATAPYTAGDHVVDRLYPRDGVMTVLGCDRIGDGWSVKWRADPVIEGVRPVTGRCPAEWLAPASSRWAMVCSMVGGQG